MRLEVAPGKYIIAVSGGVDSVALLHALTQQTGVKLVVAHFDHGIRPDSAADAQLVARLAAEYELLFVTERVELGLQASEAAARTARYTFLHQARAAHGAQAIVTAHHQDDVVETAVMNLLRGTGRRGLTSLQSTETLRRPLLQVTKQELQTYALKHGLSWREDSTNHDTRYTRNRIRKLLANADPSTRRQLLALIDRQRELNRQIDELCDDLSCELPRRWFNSLPHDVACEVMAQWLRSNGIRTYDRRTINRLVIQCKTRSAGCRLDVMSGCQLQLTPYDIRM